MRLPPQALALVAGTLLTGCGGVTTLESGSQTRTESSGATGTHTTGTHTTGTHTTGTHATGTHTTGTHANDQGERVQQVDSQHAHTQHGHTQHANSQQVTRSDGHDVQRDTASETQTQSVMPRPEDIPPPCGRG